MHEDPVGTGAGEDPARYVAGKREEAAPSEVEHAVVGLDVDGAAQRDDQRAAAARRGRVHAAPATQAEAAGIVAVVARVASCVAEADDACGRGAVPVACRHRLR